jgi:succinate-semialdehyde dehydrogenase / glutarate-semialdehyde dehydrogenase
MIQLRDPSLLKEAAFVNGKWIQANNGETLPVYNPATGELIGNVPNLGANETQLAINFAHAAWDGWKKLLAKQRSALLRKWFDLILENQEDLALIMTSEQGKPLAEARGEVAYGASFIDWFAEEAKRIYGDTIPTPFPNKQIIVLKQSVGVSAAITPWNFPIAMITRKCGAALAAGCPMIVKPSELTPFSALALAELAHRAGVPDGIFNVITGLPASIGDELTHNPLIRKLSFTGSTAVGKLLMQQCASTVKKISLELGGNAPFIVFDDADVDAAVLGAMLSKYRNSGQTCVCANRFLIQAGIYEEFAAKLAEKVKLLKTGNGLESEVNQGPLINLKAIQKVENLISDAIQKGAQALCGGHRHALGGSFFEPTVLINVDSSMNVAKEEIFGPVAPLFKFHDENEAVALANNTDYGLAAYFYSRDIARVFRVAEALEYGMVGINEGIISTEVAPFGGVKSSGIGREGSKYGIEEYLETKYLCIGL